MNKLTVFLSVAALMLFATFSAFGDGAAKHSETKAPKTAKKAVKELKNQTNCPVMGGEIDSTMFTDIQGQRVYHCCPMCSAKLKKDPDTFFKKAAEEGVLFENIQTTCPVSGMKLEEKKFFTDYDGRRIYFCSEGCIKTFDKTPQKYLDVLDQKPKKDAEVQMGHEGHQQKQGHKGHDH